MSCSKHKQLTLLLVYQLGQALPRARRVLRQSVAGLGHIFTDRHKNAITIYLNWNAWTKSRRAVSVMKCRHTKKGLVSHKSFLSALSSQGHQMFVGYLLGTVLNGMFGNL